jgi:glycosyltransferase involved in cell wall biosynthesis
MRVVIVEYAGDFRVTVRRLLTTGQENYYAQRYSIEAVASLVPVCASVIVVNCLTETAYDEVLENGVRAIGAGYTGPFDEKELVPIVAALQPDRLILRTPNLPLLKWAIAKRVRCIAIMADSFQQSGLRNKIRNLRWSWIFNRRTIEWIFNHGLSSCRSLKAIGVRPGKIVPWDWPALITPSGNAKTLSPERPHTLLYVGIVISAKGIGDVLQAIAKLKQEGLLVRLRVIGGGEVAAFSEMATALSIQDRVEFVGKLPHEKVLEEMKAADLMVVPSRHEYGEGFPMTIYETLCSRTPLIASDHPMFRSNLTHMEDSWIFRAGDVEALADGIRKLLADPELYALLSRNSAETWKRLQLPVKFAEAMHRWLADGPEDREWFSENSLARL